MSKRPRRDAQLESPGSDVYKIKLKIDKKKKDKNILWFFFGLLLNGSWTRRETKTTPSHETRPDFGNVF